MFEFEHLLDVNRLYTNNIHHVAEMYGIEAAQRSIIKELRAVQSAYDIKVPNVVENNSYPFSLSQACFFSL